jgi:phosphate transport system permease protein
MTIALGRTTRARARSRTAIDGGFRAILIVAIGVAVVGLFVLLGFVVIEGWPRLNTQLLTSFPSSNPVTAGARSAIFGTLWIMGLTALFTIPLGVGAATYLEEFAPKDRWYTRLIELNIQNLAAVPSIVFGILGLAFVVRGPLDLGPVVLSGAIILSLVVLPTVIIAAREALRAVPPSIREGAMAVGATRWQAVSRQVLPPSVPGIATGIILGLSRAIGEAAPLLLVGALTYVPFTPTGLDSRFTVLPVQIFNWVSRPQEEFDVLAGAAIIVLLAILLTMNATAIWLRNRYARKW